MVPLITDCYYEYTIPAGWKERVIQAQSSFHTVRKPLNAQLNAHRNQVNWAR